MSLLLRDVEVDGRRLDVLVSGSRIRDVGPGLDEVGRAVDVIDGRGAALLPGLHDHHLHLLALAAAGASVDCAPAEGPEDLAAALRQAPGDPADPADWIRAVGYHESAAGPLDRWALDRLVADRPVRVQHRSGALWMLNSAAIRRVEHVLDGSPDVERAPDGTPNGRLWRYDARLRPALPTVVPDLAAVGRRLARFGVTGVTDATPDLEPDGVVLIGAAHRRGDLPQRVTLLGAPDGVELPSGLARGPRKILLRDHDLPPHAALRDTVADSHEAGRAVAVHCVTAESLVLTLSALGDVGTLTGDRIEHAAVVPPGVAEWMARLRVAVVTQPDFLRTRGDDYVRDVDAADLPGLYPFHSLCAAGVATAVSSDAPFGDLDPWQAMRTAASRISRAGRVLGADERVPVSTALQSYLSRAAEPGGPPRTVGAGQPADLCLLRVPLAEAFATPAADLVRLTVIGGRIAHGL